MADGPKKELPPLELGLWMAGGIFVVMGVLVLVFASRLDSGDNRARRTFDKNAPGKHGRNRRGAIMLLAAGSAALVAALVVSLSS